MQKTLKNVFVKTLSDTANMASNKAFVLVPATTFAIALIFGVAFPTNAEAAATTSTSNVTNTYIVDLTGQGCGNNCADFYKYLASQGISITSTNGNGANASSNGNVSNANNNGATATSGTANRGATSTRPGSYQYVAYPYQVYTYFPETNLGNTSGYNSTNTGAYNNGYSTGAHTSYGTNYTPYPYQTYTYYQNPSQRYDSYMTGSYPDPVYTYYGTSSAQAQLNKYQKVNEFNPYTYTSGSYGYTNYGSQYGYGSTYGSGFYQTSGNGQNSGSGFTIIR